MATEYAHKIDMIFTTNTTLERKKKIVSSIAQNAIFSSSELKVIFGKDASESCDHGCLLHVYENLLLDFFFLLTFGPLQDGHHGIGDKLLRAFSSRQQHSEKLT